MTLGKHNDLGADCFFVQIRFVLLKGTPVLSLKVNVVASTPYRVFVFRGRRLLDNLASHFRSFHFIRHGCSECEPNETAADTDSIALKKHPVKVHTG